jgi:hypothetical protein
MADSNQVCLSILLSLVALSHVAVLQKRRLDFSTSRSPSPDGGSGVSSPTTPNSATHVLQLAVRSLVNVIGDRTESDDLRKSLASNLSTICAEFKYLSRFSSTALPLSPMQVVPPLSATVPPLSATAPLRSATAPRAGVLAYDTSAVPELNEDGSFPVNTWLAPAVNLGHPVHGTKTTKGTSSLVAASDLTLHRHSV